jgi:hypothetical protein
MTEVGEMSPRERNQLMMGKIRADEPKPYAEGRYVLRVVSVPGRTSGEPRPWPIAITQFNGHRYVCAPNRQRDWVRNLLATGRCDIERDDVPAHWAVLIEGDEAARVVATYLGVLSRPSTMWPFPADAPASEIREHTHEIAVFRLEPLVA